MFVAYQVVNTFAFIFNCYGKFLPAIGKTSLYTSLVSFVVILITVPAKAPTHQAARFVFANFVNQTGWKQNGIGKSKPPPEKAREIGSRMKLSSSD